jgi:Bacteriophage HK97-gp10, putative tail-component
MASFLKTTNNAVTIIHRAIVRGLQKGAQIVRNNAILNVTGRILNRDTGRLATSITTRVVELGGGGALDVGTQVKYGGYWERGFFRYGKFYRRQWLRPAVDQSLPQVTRLVEAEVAKEIKNTFARSVTVNIKIA